MTKVRRCWLVAPPGPAVAPTFLYSLMMVLKNTAIAWRQCAQHARWGCEEVCIGPCVRALRARTPPAVRRRTRAHGCARANGSAPMQITCMCTHVHTHTNSSACNRVVPCVRACSARTISSARSQTRARGCACPCIITYGLLSVCSGRHLRAGGRRKNSDKVSVGAAQCPRVTALCCVFFRVPRCAAGHD